MATKKFAIFFMVGLLLMTCFTCFIGIGYATLTDDLKLDGKANVQIPEGLFITSVRTTSTSNTDKNTVSFVEYSTTVNSVVSRKGNSAGTVVYMITVLNNTNYEYAYRGLYYMNTYGNNSYVSTSNSNSKLGVVVNFPEGKIVGPKETLTFTVTYTIGRSVSSSLNLDTMLNYQFGINVTSIDKAVDIVHAKFLDILNKPTTYQQLVDVLDDKFDGEQEWTSNYVGNVGNAVDNDMMTVETLFAGQLTMMINGQAQKAWVIIKHENLDGNEMTGDDYTVNFSWGEWTYRGCEMTLYMNHTVNATNVNECTVGCKRTNCTCVLLAFFNTCPEFFYLCALSCVKNNTDRADSSLALFLDFNDLEVNCLTNKSCEVCILSKTGMRCGNEYVCCANLNCEAAFNCFKYLTGNNFATILKSNDVLPMSVGVSSLL